MTIEKDIINAPEHLPEKVELTKNSKGFTWTIGVRGKEGSGEILIKRIEALNKQMLEKFSTPGE